MINYIIMCRSLTYAQRTSRVLEHAGMAASIMRAPQGLDAGGCAYCIKISERRLDDALSLMSREGIRPGKTYRADAYDSYTEVLP